MSAIDVAALVVFAFVVAITFILGFHLTSLMQGTVLNSTATGSSALSATSQTMLNYDYLFPAIILGMGAATLVSAYFVRSHPVFFVFSILALFVVTLLAAQLSNAFISMMTGEPGLNASAQNFPLTFQLFNNLPAISWIIGVLAIVVMAGKPSQPQGLYG